MCFKIHLNNYFKCIVISHSFTILSMTFHEEKHTKKSPPGGGHRGDTDPTVVAGSIPHKMLKLTMKYRTSKKTLKRTMKIFKLRYV